MTKYPFEAPLDEILLDSDRYVDAIFSCLESEFLIMPKGAGFVEYPVVDKEYEALKAATKGLSELEPAQVGHTYSASGRIEPRGSPGRQPQIRGHCVHWRARFPSSS
jgi:hypothetical protein